MPPMSQRCGQTLQSLREMDLLEAKANDLISLASKDTADPGTDADDGLQSEIGALIRASLASEGSHLREMSQLSSVAVISSELPVNIVDDCLFELGEPTDLFELDEPTDLFELGEPTDLLELGEPTDLFELGDTTQVIASRKWRNARIEPFPSCANISTEYLISIGVIES